MRGAMKLLLPMCGMTAKDVGCHSFRRGTATGLAHINAPSCVVKGIGIWGSGAYLGYTGATEPGAMEQVMLLMAEADPSGLRRIGSTRYCSTMSVPGRRSRGGMELAHGVGGLVGLDARSAGLF